MGSHLKDIEDIFCDALEEIAQENYGVGFSELSLTAKREVTTLAEVKVQDYLAHKIDSAFERSKEWK